MRGKVLVPATALVILCGLGAWWLQRRPTRSPEAVVEAPPEPTDPSPAPAKAVVRRPLPPRAVAPDARLELEYASDGKPYMPPGPEYPQPNTFAHPHPITDQHKRIHRENAMLYQLNEAMDGKEPARLRTVLNDYREEYPDDPHDMQKGYALIADCLERPADEAVHAEAERYFKEETASTLRRFVLRHCLTK